MNKVLASIAFRLPAATAALCAVVAGFITYVGYTSSAHHLEVEAADRLGMAIETRKERIGDWLNDIVGDVDFARSSSTAQNALAALQGGWTALEADAASRLRRLYIEENPHPPSARAQQDTAGDGSSYSDAHARFHPLLRDMKTQSGFRDLMLFDNSGRLIYSVAKEFEFGANFASGSAAATELVKAVRTALDTAQYGTQIVDFAPLADGSAAAFVVGRIEGRPSGVLVARIDTAVLEHIIHGQTGLGETGEVDLIGRDGTMRAGSGSRKVLDPLPAGPALSAAQSGERAVLSNIPGLSGAPAMVVIDQITDYDLNWSLIGLQDRSEVMASAYELRNQLLLVLVAAVVVASLIGWLLARGLGKRLASLGRAMSLIGEKKHDTVVPGTQRQDEIGLISRNLETFRDRLAQAEGEAKITLFRSRAFQNSSVAMMMVDREGNIIEVNTSTTDMFTTIQDDLRKRWPGFDAGRLAGQNIDQFHRNPAHQRALITDPARLPVSTEVSIGDLRLQVNVSAILDSEGQLVGAIAEWKDVRELRMNQSVIAAMRRSQIMIEYAADFRVLSVNEVFSKVFGLSATEAVGRSFAELFSTTEEPRELLGRMQSGQSISQKTRRTTRDGREIWVEVTMSPIFDGRGNIDRVLEISTDATALEHERAAVEEERRKGANAQKRVVDDLKRGLSGLAEGNLTVMLTEPFSEEYDQLRHDFNAALDRLTEVMGRLVATTNNINSGALEMSQAADDLSHRTENQAATLEETAAALDELTTSVKSAAEGAGEADRAVRSARENAEASGQVVLQAVAAMSEIEKSSDQISQIIGVIDDIAFQTNLLALNAGVEAARAGEAGRGFAVVASEVRSLAQRSSEAAKEIKTLISASSGHVERGVNLVGQTGEALKRIVESVAHIAGLVSEIAASSVEQSTGLSEINTGVNQLDEVTQQNAAMVEQTTAASHSLKQEAEALTSLVSMFRIRQGAGAEVVGLSPSRRPHVPERSDSHAAPRSGAARTGTSDGWEDF